jgi:hypothetical protein
MSTCNHNHGVLTMDAEACSARDAEIHGKRGASWRWVGLVRAGGGGCADRWWWGARAPVLGWFRGRLLLAALLLGHGRGLHSPGDAIQLARLTASFIKRLPQNAF